jgi:16S rRNA (uracil1498-N3)-methyltransferase
VTEHHFFVTPEHMRDGVVELTGDEAHHAGRVLRLREGESITVADGTGRVVEAVVRRIGKTIEGEITLERTAALPSPSITLFQAVMKGEKMDAVIEKAVEVGVRHVVPFTAERTIVRWDDSKARKAADRWSAIARSASKQCRAPLLSEVDHVVGSTHDLKTTAEIGIALHEGGEKRLRDVLPSTPPDEVALVVGPEGGLSSHEVEGLASKGFVPAGLGQRILRSETAGIVGAAIVLHIYGSLG